MNDISLRLLWCLLQVTVICGVSGLLAGLLRSWTRTSVASVSLYTLMAVSALSLLAFSPWPCWISTTQKPVKLVVADASPTQSLIAEAQTIPSSGKESVAPSLFPRTTWLPSWQEWRTELSEIGTRLVNLSLPWLIPVLCVSLLLGILRYWIGWRAIQQLLKTSVGISDLRVLRLARGLQHQLEIGQVALREHPALPAPVTFGWRSPTIMLPNDWRHWNATELRSVLAHELAHIARNDFRTLALAQLVVLLHFYHPLVHWLVSSLRIEQELAADAAAAKLAGGSDKYLSSLVALALRMDSRPVVWPLRCFLPTSGAFLRRIEMLKNPFRRADSDARWVRVASVLCVLLVGIIVAGVRPQPAVAQKTQEPSAASAPGDKLPPNDVRLSMDHVMKIARAMHNYYAQHKSFPPAVITGPNGVQHSWRVAILPQLGYTDLHSRYKFDEPWDSPANKKLLSEEMPDVYLAPAGDKALPNTSYLVVTGKGTGFATDQGIKIEDISDGTVNTLLVAETKVDIPWTQPKDIIFAPDKPLPRIGGIHPDGFVCATFDGAGHFIPGGISDDLLKQLLLPRDNYEAQSVFDWDAFLPPASQKQP